MTRQRCGHEHEGSCAYCLVDEACALGDEAIRLAMKANAMPVSDIRRWHSWQRMLEINKRLKQISEGNRYESRTL